MSLPHPLVMASPPQQEIVRPAPLYRRQPSSSDNFGGRSIMSVMSSSGNFGGHPFSKISPQVEKVLQIYIFKKNFSERVGR